MRHLLLVTCAIALLFTSAPSAQFGALKKLGDAAKKAAEPADSSPKPGNATPAAPASAAATQPATDPRLIPITDTSLTALERGLQTEITLRAAYKKELDEQATQLKQYQTCVAQTNTSPEMMAVAQRTASLLDQVKTQDEMMKVMTQISAERDAVTARRCGKEPASPSSTQARLQEIVRTAAAAAAPIQ
jgi:hypothetical protein